MKINNFWLKQSNLLRWSQKPTFAYKKKKDNYTDWYPDGKINIYDNCITRNIESGLGKKIAIISNSFFIILLSILHLLE